MKILVELDGVNHINVYSKGKTALGRFLSNFAHTQFTLAEHGTFASVEAYWYWLKGAPDDIRTLYGFRAKQYGRANMGESRVPEGKKFSALIAEAIKQKMRTHRWCWKPLAESAPLPLMHYYVFGSTVKDAGYRWILDVIEEVRQKLVAHFGGLGSNA